MTTSDDGDLLTHVDRLTDAVQRLAFANQENAAATREALRRRTRLEWIVLGVSVLLVLGLGVVAWNQSAVRAGQRKAASASASARETLHVIKDCTDPAGECARKGQANQVTVVTQINDGALLAVICAIRHHGDLTASRECVAELAKPVVALNRSARARVYLPRGAG